MFSLVVGKRTSEHNTELQVRVKHRKIHPGLDPGDFGCLLFCLGGCSRITTEFLFRSRRQTGSWVQGTHNESQKRVVKPFAFYFNEQNKCNAYLIVASELILGQLVKTN